jgi:tRNA threonylcarbamoyladenosine biosynthesis protein TsaB
VRILGLETSGETSSVALIQDGRVVAERAFAARMALSQSLTGHLQAVTETATLAEAGLDALAVSLGPGSFTGLRVGVALAKAVAHALGLPLVGIPTHEVMAWAPRQGGAPVCVLQHARERDVYTTFFPAAGGGGAPAPCRVAGVDEALAGLPTDGPPVLLAGDAVARHADLIAALPAGRVQPVPPALWLARAASVAAMAAERLPSADPDAYLNLRPIYVLASQAERAHGVDLGLS